MIRALLVFAFLLVSARAANATICTIPTTLVNGNIVDAAQLNGNFTSLQTCGNAIDNTNIGGNGVFASQVKPTTAGNATFGGTQVYTFPAGLNVNGALLTAASGLTVTGTTTFNTPPTMSGANITAATIPNTALVTTPIDVSATAQTKAGVLNLSAGLNATAASTFSAQPSNGTAFIPSADTNVNIIRGTNAANNANIWGIDANGYIHTTGTVGAAQFNGSGAGLTTATIPNAALVTTPVTTITAGTGVSVTGSAPSYTISSTTQIPVYNASGATGGGAVGFKIVYVNVQFNATNGVTVSLTGASVFTSGGTFSCFASDNNVAAQFDITKSSGTAFVVNVRGGANITAQISTTCMGT